MMERIKHELHELLPPTIFFLITFHIVVFSRALMLSEYGVKISAVAGATIGALLVAKVVLIADHLLLHQSVSGEATYLQRRMEDGVLLAWGHGGALPRASRPLWWRGGDLAVANHQLWNELVWPHFWAVQLWLVVLLLVYCSLREFVRVVGRREVMRMFFGSRRQPSTP